METLRIKREEQERKRQSDEQREKSFSATQPTSIIPQSVPIRTNDITTPPIQGLYPSHRMPSVINDLKVVAK